MSISNHILVFSWLLLLLQLGTGNAVSKSEQPQTFIIHLDHSHKPTSFSTHESWHRSILNSLSDPVDDQEMLLYSYNHVLHGFCARLTKSQLSEIEGSPAHIATHKDSIGKLLTTYSPRFLGLNHNHGLWPTASYGEGVIVGVIDSGIWPESPSFNDKGMPPVPKRWRGQCENGTTFSHSGCNRKLIGARVLNRAFLAAQGKQVPSKFDYGTARDFSGHGTHTSSTAAGNHVHGVSHFGYAKGTARGMAPRAHIATYKVIFTPENTGLTSDVLAAMDKAIADGVDIISISLAFPQEPYFDDPIAIGSLSAIEKGIFVVCAAGNDGQFRAIHNGAPWITTVGASTLDRSFTATVTLGNGSRVEGTSYFPENIYIADAHLYYGQGNKNKSICYHGQLDHSEVRGKIVLCDPSTEINVTEQEKELARVGAYAGILISDLPYSRPENYSIPSLVLSTASGALVREYVTRSSTIAKVKKMTFVSTKVGVKPAPQVASFSSRGIDPINPDILKPDIVAPGVDILAAVIPSRPYQKVGKYNLVTDYGLMSGTSMATPHVAGVAALLKKVHPEWSPAAIRSAIMTTAYIRDNTGDILKEQSGRNATPLFFGAGHIDPNKAVDPGLIYDLGLQDYIDYLCGFGYTKKQMRTVTRGSQWNCSQQPHDLNYASFIAIFNKSDTSTVKKFRRVVTNVGNDASVYKATVENTDSRVSIKIEPNTLSFSRKYQKQTFSVSVEIGKQVTSGTEVYPFLKWIDQNNHVVSSPIEVLRF